MSQSSKNKSSSSTATVSNAFKNEMEDELDQIYHNFISRGTFELPISSKFSNLFIFIICTFSFLAQKTQEKKKVVLNEKDEDDSDDEDDEQSKKFHFIR